MLHQSLRDLRTDYIDLYLVHWPDPRTDIRVTMEVLAQAKEAGKIRALGLSNTNLEELALASEIAEPEGFQAQYNLFEREIEDTVLSHARKTETGCMCWGPLHKGILTGRVVAGRTFDEVDARRRAPWWKKVDHTPHMEAVAAVRPEVESAGHSLLEMALGHVLADPAMTTALCGVRNLGQLESAVNALENLPPADLLDYVRTVTAKAVQ
jgi:aryl-alcohol dehydrogenase-like predicted oxidoreductase